MVRVHVGPPQEKVMFIKVKGLNGEVYYVNRNKVFIVLQVNEEVVKTVIYLNGDLAAGMSSIEPIEEILAKLTQV